MPTTAAQALQALFTGQAVRAGTVSAEDTNARQRPAQSLQDALRAGTVNITVNGLGQFQINLIYNILIEEQYNAYQTVLHAAEGGDAPTQSYTEYMDLVNRLKGD